MFPTEEEIKHIMELTGMDFIQARNHLVQQKRIVREAVRVAFEIPNIK